jgi:hypothetical protein
MTAVWLVESGDYEQRSVILISASLDAAMDELRRRYAHYDERNDPNWSGTWELVDTNRGKIFRRSSNNGVVSDYEITVEELVGASPERGRTKEESDQA